jgi:hypothetical protein
MISPQPYNRAIDITKSDTVPLVKIGDPVTGTPIQAIYVGGAGTIVLGYNDGTTATLTACLVGVIYPVTADYVMAATAATLLVGLYRV